MAETTMLERVACAISGAPFPTARSLAKAHAAVEAMREPNSPMLQGGLDYVPAGVGSLNIREMWVEMIDAALAEHPGSSGLPDTSTKD